MGYGSYFIKGEGGVLADVWGGARAGQREQQWQRGKVSGVFPEEWLDRSGVNERREKMRARKQWNSSCQASKAMGGAALDFVLSEMGSVWRNREVIKTYINITLAVVWRTWEVREDAGNQKGTNYSDNKTYPHCHHRCIQNTVQVVLLSAQGPQEMMAAAVLTINNLIISPQTMQTCGSYLFSVLRLSFLSTNLGIIIPTF